MRIDYSKLDKKFWFEDHEGNLVDENDQNACIYRSCFPLELHERFYEYRYHPKNPVIRYFCRKSEKFYKWVSKGKSKTFKLMLDAVDSFGGRDSEDCIVAMVNSGDFTLEQAIWVYGKSCERCVNALLYKYLDGKCGYKEYSDEWERCNTVCDFCKS